MKRKLFITLITTVIGLVIIFAGYASIFLFDRVAAPIKYDAQLSDFDWPNGAGIVFIRTASNSYEVGVEPGYHIASTDGKITKHIQSNDPYALEVLSPTELLIAEHEELFFITPESIDSITTQREEISFISLSPKKEYLKSGFDEETCIATFDFVTVGECTNPTNTILDVIDWETHYADGEWDASENTYIMRIRSTEIHDKVDPVVKTVVNMN